MTRPLTTAQQKVLLAMKEGKLYSAYDLKCSIATLYSLRRRGFLKSTIQTGSMWCPRVGIKFFCVEPTP